MIKRFLADNALYETGERGPEVVLSKDYDALSNLGHALAVMCRDSYPYKSLPSGYTYRQIVDELLSATQYVSDKAVDSLIDELGKLPGLSLQGTAKAGE